MQVTFTQTETQTRSFHSFVPGTVIRRDNGDLWLRGYNGAAKLYEGRYNSWGYVVDPNHIALTFPDRGSFTVHGVAPVPTKYNIYDLMGTKVGTLRLDMTGA